MLVPARDESRVSLLFSRYRKVLLYCWQPFPQSEKVRLPLGMPTIPCVEFVVFFPRLAVPRKFVSHRTRWKIIQHKHQCKKQIEKLTVRGRKYQHELPFTFWGVVCVRAEKARGFVGVFCKAKHSQEEGYLALCFYVVRCHRLLKKPHEFTIH